jgi:ribosomal-protein-alanine N-acetyltransferase
MFPWSKPSVSRLVPLRGEHAEECADIHAVSFAHPWPAQEIEALLSAASAVGAAALDPITLDLRGFVLSRRAADEAELLTIATAPAWRRHGVGRELLEEHLRQLKQRGVKAMFLEVDPDNAAAMALYKRFGFVKVGERGGYYRRADGSLAGAWILRREL